MTDLYRTTFPPDADDYVAAVTNPGIPELPLDYTWINNEPGDITQELADGALIPPHPAAGSYWVGYQNDATRGAANRPHQVLGESIDKLDELIRRAVAVPKSTVGTAPVGGLASLTLGAAQEVYLGDGTYSYVQLFEIVDSDGAEIIDSAGVKCVVTLTNPPSGDPALKYGFSLAAVQLTIDPPVPAGVNYEVRYGGRGCLAELPREAFVIPFIAGSQQVDASVRRMLLDLHGYEPGTPAPAWTDAWTATIWNLAYSGLDGRYRKATTAIPTVPETGFDQSLNTAGAGSFYYRTGPAMAGYSRRALGVYSDTFDAIWRAHGQDAGGALRVGGGALFTSQSGWPGTMASHEFAPNLANYLALHTHKMDSGCLSHTNGYTSITYEGAVEVNWSAGEAFVTLLETGDHFWLLDGFKRSAIITKHDIVEIYNAAWTPRWKAFVIDRLDPADDTVAYLKELNGSDLPAGVLFTGQIRWHSNVFTVSGGTSEQLRYYESLHPATPATVNLGGMTYAAHPRVENSSNLTDYLYGDPAKFLAVDTGATSPAVKWGGRVYEVDAILGTTLPTYAGTLWGDGSITAYNAVVNNDLSVLGTLAAHLVGASGVSITLNDLVGVGGVISAHSGAITTELAAATVTTTNLGATGGDPAGINVTSDLVLETGEGVVTDDLLVDTVYIRTPGGTLTVVPPVEVVELRYKQPAVVTVTLDADPKVQAIDLSAGMCSVTVVEDTAASGVVVDLTIDESTVEPGGIYYVNVTGSLTGGFAVQIAFSESDAGFQISQLKDIYADYIITGTNPSSTILFMCVCTTDSDGDKHLFIVPIAKRE